MLLSQMLSLAKSLWMLAYMIMQNKQQLRSQVSQEKLLAFQDLNLESATVHNVGNHVSEGVNKHDDAGHAAESDAVHDVREDVVQLF